MFQTSLVKVQIKNCCSAFSELQTTAFCKQGLKVSVKPVVVLAKPQN